MNIKFQKRTNICKFAAAMLFLPMMGMSAQTQAETSSVKVINTVPITGNVGITGTANVNVTNTAVPVTGTVGISGTPTVNVGTMPPVQIGAITDRPFFVGFIGNNIDNQVTGAFANKIGVTSIIIYNSTTQVQTFPIANAVVSNTDCGSGGYAFSTAYLGGGFPSLDLNAEPMKTTQFTFPTPIVFEHIGLNPPGVICIYAGTLPRGVEIFVSGVQQ
jgi:hypothetical protein